MVEILSAPAEQITATDLSMPEKLALAYQIIAYCELDDLTYTHLSARIPGEEAYYIFPFGLCFEEVTVSRLLKVDFQGKVLEGDETYYNPTGYAVHATIYQGRKDINAIFHTHSTATTAISAYKGGLLPLSQFALQFYGHIGYHSYGSLILDKDKQGDALIKDLADHYVMLLNNHGSLTCGRTIEEAMYYTHHLEQACRVQCALLPTINDCVMPSSAMCEQAQTDLNTFEKDLGARDWAAWQRRIESLDIDYKG